MGKKVKAKQSLKVGKAQPRKRTGRKSGSGLAFLAQQRKQKENGALLLNMVLEERGSDQELRSLVSHPALAELILLTLDHKKVITARINSEKSRDSAKTKALFRQKELYAWLDKNIDSYPRRLDHCAENACRALGFSEKQVSTIRKEISQYRKMKETGN